MSTAEVFMEKKRTLKKSFQSNTILDEHDFLSKLVVGIGEVSEITGIPQRQLRYWQQKGIITTIAGSGISTRRFNYSEIKKILLIKELIDEGYTLEAAANKVKKRIELIDSTFGKLKKQRAKRLR
jgi:DNA-binding transcriptional MerR regulator